MYVFWNCSIQTTCQIAIIDVLLYLALYCLYDLSAVWGGAKLADVLQLIGIPMLTCSTQSGGKHVEFVSIDKCKVLSMAY